MKVSLCWFCWDCHEDESVGFVEIVMKISLCWFCWDCHEDESLSPFWGSSWSWASINRMVIVMKVVSLCHCWNCKEGRLLMGQKHWGFCFFFSCWPESCCSAEFLGGLLFVQHVHMCLSQAIFKKSSGIIFTMHGTNTYLLLRVSLRRKNCSKNLKFLIWSFLLAVICTA